MTFLLGGFVCMAFGAFGVIRMRHAIAERPAAEENAGLATAAAVLLGGGSVTVVLHVAHVILEPHLNFPESVFSWSGAAAVGASFGSALWITLVLLDVSHKVRLWAHGRLDTEDGATSGWLLRKAVVGAGIVGLCTAASVGVARLGYEVVTPFIPAFVVATIQLYEHWVVPWTIYRKACTFDTSGFAEIHRWLDGLHVDHRAPAFRLCIQEGDSVDALATGGVYKHFIVVGRGLLDKLSIEHVKGVLAHEIGHVLNRDLTRRAAMLIGVGFILHALYFNFFVAPWGMNVLSVFPAGFGVALFWGILPGFFQRRWEYEADRKAVELIGDPEVVAQALERFSDVNEVDLDQKSLTHPPMRARIEAIRELGARDVLIHDESLSDDLRVGGSSGHLRQL